MPYPDLTVCIMDFGFSELWVGSYLAHLFLQRHLNQFHTWSTILAEMKWLPGDFKFSEDDEPATDILSARLRAKYWDVKVTKYQPFIKQILDYLATFTGQRPAIENSAVEYAKIGIRALFESTRAFHGLDGRAIVTNAFVIAHI